MTKSVLSITVVSLLFFFFKQKTAYEMRISDWSSDVCSSDLSTMYSRRCDRSMAAKRARHDRSGADCAAGRLRADDRRDPLLPARPSFVAPAVRLARI